MAAIGRESRLMPTVKCSTCGAQVQIALMGEHVCTTSASPAAEASPPLPAASLFGRLMPTFSNPLTQKQQPRAPPQVDTSAANRAYMGQTQLTPVSLSSGSQSAVSPQTPSALRPGLGKADEYFGPKIANNSPPPPQSPRPGGYGGLDGSSGDDDSALPANAPKKQAPNLMERLNSIPAGPFGTGRRPSAAGPERPGTSAGSPSTFVTEPVRYVPPTQRSFRPTGPLAFCSPIGRQHAPRPVAIPVGRTRGPRRSGADDEREHPETQWRPGHLWAAAASDWRGKAEDPRRPNDQSCRGVRGWESIPYAFWVDFIRQLGEQQPTGTSAKPGEPGEPGKLADKPTQILVVEIGEKAFGHDKL
ncbi:4bdade72-ac61-4ceb-bf77-e7d5b3d20f2d [Thermothielavioides terrestris]|uniref:4bdade72-ac61-4ceb-bf77-e7d5b3d20f2d n=1 Tax=Thermothielavioides terrestris TaxID=2587410 RepID=A0A3S4ANI2_9PEZI|nr:4bdade72-ac61-4ceb-bf77-e7d5b3d20f2d [Thermothielavioides terrestris]